ncbi:DUF2231 domain-containing protein [Corynebacterium comes]|uniref:DUF2231 domain-containing protein n=1 Tax=Corynebacterium comes TaxID=2675218 RepID=A0A6B8W3M2_9CORY|nr:DUF2231 domain-containing protein [Corynebacterium comes]QGU04420.1 hypothetical protein CETAM_05750 [Corynebacterium comes]
MLEILGLPTHILLLHAAVVIVPMAAVSGIVYALRPPWRRLLEWPVMVLAVLAAGLTVFTASAGEALERALPPGPLIQAHAEQGERLEIAVAMYTIAVVLSVAVTGPWVGSKVRLLTTLRDTRWLVLAMQVLTVLTGLVAIYQVVVTGHTGAQAVWTDWRTG